MLQKKELGKWFFRWRDFLPVPLVLGLLRWARPATFGWLCGIPLVLLGQMLRIWSLKHIGPTTRSRKICADELVTTGPYAMCRNPLYLANSLKISGLLLVCRNLKFSLLVIFLYSVEFLTMIFYEENYLESKFPGKYARYRSAVPAFIPRFSGRGLDEPSSFDWKTAVKSERKTFMSTGSILALLFVKSVLSKNTYDA